MESVEPLEPPGPSGRPAARPLEYAAPSAGNRRVSVQTSGDDLVVTFRPSGWNAELNSMLVVFLLLAAFVCLFICIAGAVTFARGPAA